jgi:hypothetical protein
MIRASVLSVMAAASLATACVSVPAAPPPSSSPSQTPSQSVVVPLPDAPRAALLLRRAGREDAPVLDDVLAMLGGADVARRETAGALLTYRLPNCSLVLAFTMDGLNRLRLAQVQTGAPRFGDPAPSLDQCAAELDARPSQRVG